MPCATDSRALVSVRPEPNAALHRGARAGLEAISARLAAQHSTPEARAAMSAALDARTRAHEAGDLNAYTKADTDFHCAVVHASGNPLVARLHAAVADMLNAPSCMPPHSPRGPVSATPIGIWSARSRADRPMTRPASPTS
ncbi:FadR family transcriptional regulator [Rhodococcus sp. HNM0563]|nr:FadR family transcriptional regulator [Rhodococcus sp. HNM0563]